MSERAIDTGKTELMLPELLAPAGGRRQLMAAVDNGADAVYMGGSLFNARMKAENFSQDDAEGDLKWGIDYAHARGVRVYITLNTLIKERELPKAFEYACSLYEMGADAVILQDMGLARLIHKYMPDFPMHLSTQGTVYNRSGVEMAAELGFSRVVPARECSLEELASLCGSPVEIEVFVHGALCMCYSGQCQMSRLLGGGSARSGNRGLCAQPCRLLYRDESGKPGYFLSPKDICTIDYLPELTRAGVSSLKIEGRLKSPEYVAVVTGIYRRYLDAFAKTGRCIVDKEDRRRLLQIFNRGGFTSGYLLGNPGDAILSGSSPKNTGIPVGRVAGTTGVKGGRRKGKSTGGSEFPEGRQLVDVKLFPGETVDLGDGVEIAGSGSGAGNVVTYVNKLSDGTLRLGDFKAYGKRTIKAGDKVYKVTDRKLREEALAGVSAGRKTSVDMLFVGRIGKPAALKVFADDKVFEAEASNPVEKAIKRPADPIRIREQLMKLGDTPFKAGIVEIKVDDDAMIPVSVINGLRRQAVDMALSSRCVSRTPVSEAVVISAADDIRSTGERYSGGLGNAKEKVKSKVLVPLEIFMDDPSCREGKLPYVLNVSKGNLDSFIASCFDDIVAAAGESGIALGNLGWVREFRRAGVKVYGDYGLNVCNSQALELFAEWGVEVIEWSDERPSRSCRREPAYMTDIPMMITEHPIGSSYLTDRKGVKHKVIRWYSGDKYLVF
ncbi:MAG: U32 family peptidase [Lentihominibacter sp.]